MADTRTAQNLDEEMRKSIDDVLSTERDLAFQQILKFDGELTKYSFLANAGGATATLAFLGARPDQVSVAIWPLIFFLVGLIATGLEIRALLYNFGEKHRDAARRRQQFFAGQLSIVETRSISA
jgi:hypothetical protein